VTHFNNLLKYDKTASKLQKVLILVLKIRAIINVQANQHLSNISVIHTEMKKTTVDQVTEGLDSECRGDLKVAAQMSNQMLF